MKKIIIAALFLLAPLIPVLSQNILVMEKAGFKKNYKYNQGDKIMLKTKDSVNVKGMITTISDTSIVLDFYTEIKLRNIIQVNRTRWGISILSKALLIGGAGLVIVEAVNGVINGTGINTNVLYIGAGAAAAGALLYPFDKSRYTIGPDKWKLKVLQIEKNFEYQKNKPIKF
jgi:hypothetical protein